MTCHIGHKHNEHCQSYLIASEIDSTSTIALTYLCNAKTVRSSEFASEFQFRIKIQWSIWIYIWIQFLIWFCMWIYTPSNTNMITLLQEHNHTISTTNPRCAKSSRTLHTIILRGELFTKINQNSNCNWNWNDLTRSIATLPVHESAPESTSNPYWNWYCLHPWKYYKASDINMMLDACISRNLSGTFDYFNCTHW